MVCNKISKQPPPGSTLTVSLVFSAPDAGPEQGLLVVQDCQDTKDDGRAGLELDVHQPLRHGLADVLKVHGGALDEAADGDDGVKGGGGCGRGRRLGLASGLGLGGAVNEGEQVGAGGEHGGGGVGGLGLAGLDEPGGERVWAAGWTYFLHASGSS